MSGDLINDPKHWRARAGEARQVAAEMPDEVSKQMMLGVAADYDRLAERAGPRPPVSPLPNPNGMSIAAHSFVDNQQPPIRATNATSCATRATISRAVNTTYPGQGGGDLSSDRCRAADRNLTPSFQCHNQALVLLMQKKQMLCPAAPTTKPPLALSNPAAGPPPLNRSNRRLSTRRSNQRQSKNENGRGETYAKLS
jgi:hypothetical protein